MNNFPPPVEARARLFCKTLQADVESNWLLVAAGIAAIAEAFAIPADALELNTVLFRDIKPAFLREIDGTDIVLSVEERMERFLEPDSAFLLTRIYLVSVADWLLVLLKSKWQD